MPRTPPKKSLSSARAKPDGRAPRHEAVFEKIYKIVLLIPEGRVMTYGQIARLLGGRYSPRLVGWAMHVTPRDSRNIPWHRVINSQGGISTGKVLAHNPDLQKWMLEAEGVAFDDRDKCDLSAYQWSPRGSTARKSYVYSGHTKISSKARVRVKRRSSSKRRVMGTKKK